MRQVSRFLLAACIVMFIAGCAGSKPEGEPISLTGRVVMIGNDPFTGISVEAPDGKVYRLEGEAKVLESIRQLQGRRVSFIGRSLPGLDTPVLKIESYSIQ